MATNRNALWYQAQLARNRFNRQADRLEKQLEYITNAEEMAKLSQKIGALRDKAGESYAQVIRSKASEISKSLNVETEQITKKLISGLTAQSLTTKVSFTEESIETKNRTAKSLLRNNAIGSSSGFYAATIGIWNKPDISKEARDQVIMDYLGVDNMYDAIKKVENITGQDFTSFQIDDNYMLYKLQARTGQLFITQ